MRPQYSLPERLKGGANTASNTPEKDSVFNSNREFDTQVKGIHSFSKDTEESKKETQQPIKASDYEWTNNPYTEDEAIYVSYANVIEGPMQLACFKVPEEVDKLNALLKKAGTTTKPYSHIKRLSAPATIVTPAGVVINVWYSEYLYPRKHKPTI
jgi:hypothetical protein